MLHQLMKEFIRNCEEEKKLDSHEN